VDFWYGWLKFVMGSYLRILGIKAEVSGLNNLPPGPKILVGNHPNATDSFHLLFLVKEKVHGLVEEDAMKARVVGRWLRLADQIPVITGRGKEALQAAHDRLRRGNVVLIYPEAKLTSTHQVTRAGTGVARLALAADVPVVPFGVHVPQRDVRIFHGHAHDGRPTAGGWQMRGKTYINFGPPLEIASEREQEEAYHLYRRLTDEIMRTIAGLAEQARRIAGEPGPSGQVAEV
jgi:1-acyl-sn-glycerol-3-phosphate acyltransferase